MQRPPIKRRKNSKPAQLVKAAVLIYRAAANLSSDTGPQTSNQSWALNAAMTRWIERSSGVWGPPHAFSYANIGSVVCRPIAILGIRDHNMRNSCLYSTLLPRSARHPCAQPPPQRGQRLSSGPPGAWAAEAVWGPHPSSLV